MSRRNDPMPHSRRSGMALITALLASVVLMILLTALLNTRVSELRAISGHVQTTHAQLAAEAGIDYVLGTIARDEGVLPETVPYYEIDGEHADGRFSAIADVDPETGKLRITSTGRAPRDADRTVEVLVDLELRNRLVESFALLTCQDLSLTGDSEIHDGDVYTGGDLFVGKENAIVNGDGMAYRNIVFDGAGSITGNVISETGGIMVEGGGAERVRAGGFASNPFEQPTLTDAQAEGGVNHDPAIYDLPPYCESPMRDEEIEISPEDFEAYADEAREQGVHSGNAEVSNGGTNGYDDDLHFIDGSLLVEGTPEGFAFDGTYYVAGDMTVKGDYEGTATFVVEGNLTIEGTTLSDADSNHAFIVGGDVTLAGGASIDGAIYTNGGIDASGGATVNGSVVALGEGGITGSLEVHYQTPGDEANLPNGVFAGFQIQRWRLVS